MSSGQARVTCVLDTDFAALVSIIDFLTGLRHDSDKHVWQPKRSDSSKFVANVLLPVRAARNAFAHSSQLDLPEEGIVRAHILAVRRLVMLLPSADTHVGTQHRALSIVESMLHCGSRAIPADRAAAARSELAHMLDALEIMRDSL